MYPDTKTHTHIAVCTIQQVKKASTEVQQGPRRSNRIQPRGAKGIAADRGARRLRKAPRAGFKACSDGRGLEGLANKTQKQNL